MMLKLKVRPGLLLLLVLTTGVVRTTPLLPDDRTSNIGQANKHGALSILSEALVITNGTIIDATGSEPIPNGLVAIQGNRILAVGSATDFALSAKAEVIDAAGGTIMPGIINTHVHNTHPPGTRHRFLINGVTATCDLATSLSDMAQFEQNYDNHNQPAARGFHTGPMITARGGYPSSYGFAWDYQVTTPEEARAAVVDMLDRGVDMIKVALEPCPPLNPCPVLELKQVETIVTEARTRGVPVRAHMQQAVMLDMALQAGVDVIEHVPLPFPEEVKLGQMEPEERLSLADFPEFEVQLARMAQQGVALVPTLNAGSCVTRDLPGLETETRRRMCDFQLEVVGHFYELSGVVALGNDYGNLGVERGMPLREMELLLAAGLEPMAVIEAGTHHAAHVCGYGDELGTLEAGKLADIIVVVGNPLADLAAMSRVSLVIKDGEIAYSSSARLEGTVDPGDGQH